MNEIQLLRPQGKIRCQQVPDFWAKKNRPFGRAKKKVCFAY